MILVAGARQEWLSVFHSFPHSRSLTVIQALKWGSHQFGWEREAGILRGNVMSMSFGRT